MKFALILFFFTLFHSLYSQKNEYNIWYFGYGAGVNFNSSTPSFLLDGKVDRYEGSSSLCDSAGNLIVYSDGLTVWNKNHQIVKNGEDLMGSESSTSSCLIIKHPSSNYVFIFTSPFANYQNTWGYRYNIYDIKGDSLILKNKLLLGTGSEKMTAIDHPNGIDKLITIKQHGNNLYHTFILKADGLISCPIISQAGDVQGPGKASGQGFLKYSYNGAYLANAIMGDVEKINIFKNINGKFELIKSINTWLLFGYGIEFSRNGKYMYYTISNLDSSCLYQFDILTNNTVTLRKWPIDRRIFALQMAPNGKIYVANPDSLYLGVINEPEKDGLMCDFKERGVYLGGKKCAYGLPTINQSSLYIPSINFKYEYDCTENILKFWGIDTFSANIHNWQIKKQGNPIEGNYTNKNVSHTFLDTGKYEIRYIASAGSRIDTILKFVHIYPKINKHFLGKDTSYAKGEPYSRVLKSPFNMHCQLWQDSSGLSTYTADSAGVYICKVTNQSFCEVTDTITITECINNLTTPSLYRSRDTLYTYQPEADSFVWYRNNIQYRITKEPFIRLTDTGLYRVEAAKKDHCNRSSNTNYVNKLGIFSFQLSDFNIRLYPNPSLEQVFIKSENNFILQVSDITGKIITVQENIEHISLPKGMYFFRFTIDGYRFTEKVIIL